MYIERLLARLIKKMKRRRGEDSEEQPKGEQDKEQKSEEDTRNHFTYVTEKQRAVETRYGDSTSMLA